MWKVVEDIGSTSIVDDTNRVTIAYMQPDGKGSEIPQAHQIVREHNAHNALVAALTGFMALAEERGLHEQPEYVAALVALMEAK